MGAMQTGQIILPKTVAATVVNKAKDASTIATLSPSTPQIFADKDYLVFNPTAEAEVVAEGGKKGAYEASATPIVGNRVKIQTTTRVSNELKWADEDNKLEIVKSIQEDQAQALGRALDYVVYHAVNPKSGAVMSGYSALSESCASVTATGVALNDMEALEESVNATYDVNGLALSRTFASQLRKARVAATQARLFPEVPLNLQPGNIDGVKAATSGTVNGTRCATPTGILAFMGDFSVIKWGMVRDMTAEVIEYGDPDGAGYDLKNYNQVAYRTEAMLAYAILDPLAIGMLKAPTIPAVE